jgi:hypothetical protein
MWAISTHSEIKVSRGCFIGWKRVVHKPNFHQSFNISMHMLINTYFYDSQVVECHVILIHWLLHHWLLSFCHNFQMRIPTVGIHVVWKNYSFCVVWGYLCFIFIIWILFTHYLR